MPAFSEIVAAILPLFILIGCGAIARRSGLLERDASTLLGSFALDIALPALILYTLLTSRLSLEYAALPAASTVVFAIRYRLDSVLSVALFFALTVASAASVPIMLSVLR